MVPAERIIAEFADPLDPGSMRNPGPHGIGGAWNACIDAAQSELFAILHADDVLSPEYSDDAGAGCRTSRCGFYFCRAGIIGPDDRPMFSFPDWIKTCWSRARR